MSSIHHTLILRQFTIPILKIVKVLTSVHRTLTSKHTSAMHLVVSPIALVMLLTACKSHLSLPVDFVINEVTAIYSPIFELQNTHSVLLALSPLPCIGRPIWPHIFTLPVLFVIQPLSIVPLT